MILVPHRPSSVFFDLSRFLEFADETRSRYAQRVPGYDGIYWDILGYLTPFLSRGYGALAPLAMVEPSVARERV